MSKTRKQHQLIATITNAYLGYSKSKQYKNQPFYYLDILEQTQLGQVKQDVYAFSNLVNESIWKTLEKKTWQGKNYLFWCEKRIWGDDWEIEKKLIKFMPKRIKNKII